MTLQLVLPGWLVLIDELEPRLNPWSASYSSASRPASRLIDATGIIVSAVGGEAQLQRLEDAMDTVPTPQPCPHHELYK